MARHRSGGRARRAVVCLGGIGAVAATATGGPPINVAIGTPSLDRWMYSFNSTPGTRTAMSTFGEIGTVVPGFNFDDRMAQCLIGFDTASRVPTGRGPLWTVRQT